MGNGHFLLQGPYPLCHGPSKSIRRVCYLWKTYISGRGVRYFQAYENILKYIGLLDYTRTLKEKHRSYELNCCKDTLILKSWRRSENGLFQDAS